jgi:hypothetical protein
MEASLVVEDAAAMAGLGDAAMSPKGASTVKEVAVAMAGFGDAAMSPKGASTVEEVAAAMAALEMWPTDDAVVAVEVAPWRGADYGRGLGPVR